MFGRFSQQTIFIDLEQMQTIDCFRENASFGFKFNATIDSSVEQQDFYKSMTARAH